MKGVVSWASGAAGSTGVAPPYVPGPVSVPVGEMHQSTDDMPRKAGGRLRKGKSLKPLKTIGKNISTPMQIGKYIDYND